MQRRLSNIYRIIIKIIRIIYFVLVSNLLYALLESGPTHS